MNKAQQRNPQSKKRQETLVIYGLVTIVIPMDFWCIIFCSKCVRFFLDFSLRVFLLLLDTSSRVFVNDKNTHSTLGLSSAHKWAWEVPPQQLFPWLWKGIPLQVREHLMQNSNQCSLWSPLDVHSQRCLYAGGRDEVLTSCVLSGLPTEWCFLNISHQNLPAEMGISPMGWRFFSPPTYPLLSLC